MQARESIQPHSRKDWRAWLERHHADAQGVWVVHPKVRSDIPGPSYEDIVEEALCFGWIDSVVRPVDAAGLTSKYLSPRRAGSIWAKSNKQRVEQLLRTGLMAAPGRAVIERAQADGSWSLLEEVEGHVIAPDLAAAFQSKPGSRAHFEAQAVNRQERALYWIYSAKRPLTRSARITSVVDAAARGTHPSALG